MLPPPAELLSFFQRYRDLTIVGHIEPDGDCIGSQLALASALERGGYVASVVNAGPFRRSEIAAFRDRFHPTLNNLGRKPEAVVVVDSSSPDRIGPIAAEIEALPTAVIHHHASGRAFGDVRYVDSGFKATTSMILNVIEALGITVTKKEAELLFFGLATDTGFFRFLEAGEPGALREGARLVELGASPRSVERMISGRKSFESRQLLSRMLDRSERLAEGRAILTYQTKADLLEFGPNGRDSDTLYKLLLSVESTEVLAVVKEDPEQGGCTVSFRSNHSIDVGRIAVAYGGGGHKNAAGFFSPDDLGSLLANLRRSLVEAVSQVQGLPSNDAGTKARRQP
jgi:phosphoesterase RecJ-like protein